MNTTLRPDLKRRKTNIAFEFFWNYFSVYIAYFVFILLYCIFPFPEMNRGIIAYKSTSIPYVGILPARAVLRKLTVESCEGATALCNSTIM